MLNWIDRNGIDLTFKLRSYAKFESEHLTMSKQKLYLY